MNDSTAVSTVVLQPISTTDLKGHISRIRDVTKSVMKKNVHYGIIPGTQKNSLWKPGAESLCVAFRISATYPVIEDLSDGDQIRYRVTCRGVHQTSSAILGEGMGEASTSEEKYKWRAAVCKEEFEETPEDRRRNKYKKGRNDGFYIAHQIRTEPADLANTVLKMACKRAQVAMTINVTGCSDMFTQDVDEDREREPGSDDDRGEQGAGGDAGQQAQTRSTAKPETKQPQRASGSKGVITDKQVGLLVNRLNDAQLDRQRFCQHFDILALEDLPFDKMDAALAYIKKEAAAS